MFLSSLSAQLVILVFFFLFLLKHSFLHYSAQREIWERLLKLMKIIAFPRRHLLHFSQPPDSLEEEHPLSDTFSCCPFPAFHHHLLHLAFPITAPTTRLSPWSHTTPRALRHLMLCIMTTSGFPVAQIHRNSIFYIFPCQLPSVVTLMKPYPSMQLLHWGFPQFFIHQVPPCFQQPKHSK